MKNILRYSLSFLISIFIVFGANAQVTAKKKVAVYVTGNEVENSIKKVLGAKFVTAITESGDFAAVERTSEFLAALTKENDYQTSGEVRDSQIAKLGQKFGVKYVVVADVSEAFDELFVAARLINVETGLVESAYDANRQAETMQELINLSQNVISGLFKNISKAQTEKIKRSLISSSGKINGHDYVDLGLPSGLKWATCNLGATTPTQWGNYYCWGETSPTSENFRNSSCSTLGRLMGDISGIQEYDVARKSWGATWRMPTSTEFEELINLCQWQWISGLGYKIIGPNGNFIFILAARYGGSRGEIGAAGDYWSSTPLTKNNNESANRLFFNDGEFSVESNPRNMPYTIRPVSN